MSTLRLSVGLLFLMLLLGLVGCSSTSGYRSAVTPKMRTVATIGDKPLPIVEGEPGDSRTAEIEVPDHRPRAGASDGRISGRVIDEKGEPVANARVRLAISPAPGGRVVRATTDRGGGFTLRGLRPGTTYTVIAEGKDTQGILTGRSEVEAPDTDVRIALTPTDVESLDSGNPTRVNHVSRRAATSDADPAEEQVAEVVGSSINVEDLPPAPEAESLASASSRQVEIESGPGEPSPKASAGAWRRGERSRATAGADPVPNVDDEPALAPRRSTTDFPVEGPSEDEDGPNPLPPALEPGQASRPSASQGDDHFAPDRDPTARRTVALTQDEEAPRQRPDMPPGALVALPRSSATLPLPAELPPPVDGIPGSTPSGPVASHGELPPPVEGVAPAPTSPSPSPLALASPADTSRPRPRWRDLASSQREPPALEGSQGRRVTAARGASDPNTTRVVRGSPKEPETFCRFDPKYRRIEDFRLPDPQGRPVRFQDFDSDLILLDFWGTWCQPCIRSVPHLVDLQTRLGGKQLQVVGIACEREETPSTQRAAGVAKTVRKLGINYPVLVSNLDGTCPLQTALHVQAYPTLILVDRQGRILWQDQGATPMTLARLDSMITLATKPSDSRRRY